MSPNSLICSQHSLFESQHSLVGSQHSLVGMPSSTSLPSLTSMTSLTSLAMFTHELPLSGLLQQMWQSRVEIEHSSVAYFACIASFEAL